MNIRQEQPSDTDKIWKVNAEAFDTEAEANLLNTLRNSGCDYISFVAETKSNIIGHILFTPVVLTGNNNIKIAGLAPMAVTSQYQNKGIGSKLVNAGLEICRSQGYGEHFTSYKNTVRKWL